MTPQKEDTNKHKIPIESLSLEESSKQCSVVIRETKLISGMHWGYLYHDKQPLSRQIQCKQEIAEK